MDSAIRDSRMMQEATRLAGTHGELGNTAAIRLLQIPHDKEDVQGVLRAFEHQLTREAKSKLTLDALVPPPPDVDHQRYEPLFDRYVITGKTYTTASGVVIPDQLHYFAGHMVHLYGECTNVSLVNSALAGSGYQAVTLTYADGRRTAVAQLWASKFTDTSIGAYSAMFIVVIAVRGDAPASQTSIKGDANGASSVLAMLDGAFDAEAAVYENRARLFLVRLLDTTQVAIDVGRERMGTDKRPGSIELARQGRWLRVSISDRDGRGVVGANLELADDPARYVTEVAQAAVTAGTVLRAFPRGTEYRYPAVARIGQGPVVSWQWRSDLSPVMQPVMPGTVVFDPSSDEGRTLLAWGFAPRVLGYIPNVRGVITGLTDSRSPAHYGVTRSPGTDVAGAPSVATSLALVSSPMTLSPMWPARATNVPVLRASPAGEWQQAGVLPVLRLVGQPIVARTAAATEPHAPGHPVTSAVDLAPGRTSMGGSYRRPRWAWETTFLGSLTAVLRKEPVGVTPDGLRINWHVVEGAFVGPGLDAIVLPGAADWMRIRRDGVAIVNVHACFETAAGARVYGAYGGVFDLGPDGYARALRDEFDRLPPVVVTPTYATADATLQWLNRAQCVGVGRVDMAALRVEFDVYIVRVGGRTPEVPDDQSRIGRPATPSAVSLYQRLGGHDVVTAITDQFVESVLADSQLGRYFASGHVQAGLKERVVSLLCEITGGPCVYQGRDMKTAHKGLGITEADWIRAVDLLTASLDRRKVGPRERSEFLQVIRDMERDIVEVPAGP